MAGQARSTVSDALDTAAATVWVCASASWRSRGLVQRGRGQAGQVRVERGPGGESFHFRCFMMNVIFDVGCSYGELCTEPEVAKALAKYLRAPPGNARERAGAVAE